MFFFFGPQKSNIGLWSTRIAQNGVTFRGNPCRDFGFRNPVIAIIDFQKSIIAIRVGEKTKNNDSDCSDCKKLTLKLNYWNTWLSKSVSQSEQSDSIFSFFIRSGFFWHSQTRFVVENAVGNPKPNYCNIWASSWILQSEQFKSRIRAIRVNPSNPSRKSRPRNRPLKKMTA